MGDAGFGRPSFRLAAAVATGGAKRGPTVPRTPKLNFPAGGITNIFNSTRRASLFGGRMLEIFWKARHPKSLKGRKLRSVPRCWTLSRIRRVHTFNGMTDFFKKTKPMQEPEPEPQFGLENDSLPLGVETCRHFRICHARRLCPSGADGNCWP